MIAVGSGEFALSFVLAAAVRGVVTRDEMDLSGDVRKANAFVRIEHGSRYVSRIYASAKAIETLVSAGAAIPIFVFGPDGGPAWRFFGCVLEERDES